MPTIKGIKIKRGETIPKELMKYAKFPFEAVGLKITGDVPEEVLAKLKAEKLEEKPKESKKSKPKKKSSSKKDSEKSSRKKKIETLDDLREIKGVGDETLADIKRAGYKSLDDLKAALEGDSVSLRNDRVKAIKKALEESE